MHAMLPTSVTPVCYHNSPNPRQHFARMHRTRPHSLSLRTPVDGTGYGGPPTGRSSRLSPGRNMAGRSRYCRQCTSGYIPVNPSPGYMHVPYVLPMMYAATPAPMSAMSSMPAINPMMHMAHTHPHPAPVYVNDHVPLPLPPYPLYEKYESSESDNMDETRTTTAMLSTLHRSTTRGGLSRSNLASNMIRDFEETKWIPLGDQSKEVQDWTLKRANWFQRSVELPNGVISKLHCVQMSPETDVYGTIKRSAVQRLKVTGLVRHRLANERASAEDSFSEILILPQGTDISTISYKLLTKNVQQYTEERFNETLRHSSTFHLDETDGETNTENTVVVTGKVERIPQSTEKPQPTRVWSKEYKQTVQGTVDLSADGQVVNPVVKTYTEMPDALVNLAPSPDKDTFYSIFNEGCEIRIRLDENVDTNSVKLEVNTEEEIIKVIFSRHMEGSETGSGKTSEVSEEGGGVTTTTTAYDMLINQTFKLSSNKFDISKITKRIQGRDLYLFIPFNAARSRSRTGFA